MARVLIYSLDFPPDNVSTGQLMGELALDLTRAGHAVDVVTTQPHSNPDPVAIARQPLTRLGRGPLFESWFHGIRVIHTPMPPRRKSVRSRIAGWLGFHVLGLYAAIRHVPPPDVVIIPSPLLTSGVIGWCIGLATGSRYIYNVQELYPDLGIQIGKLHNPALIAIMRLLERFVYRTAGAITVIGRGMEEKVLSRGVAREKLHYIPNFVDVDTIAPGPHDNGFRREHALSSDDFVVTYAGNMAFSQRLDVLVDAAALLQSEPRIRVMFIGGGGARDELRAEATRRGLKNVMFVDHQPVTRVPEIYAASSVSVVPLLETIGADAIPSKVYRIMAAARPLLTIASDTSELAAVVREAKAGVVVPPDGAALARAIRELASLDRAQLARFGDAGRAYAQTHVARPTITGRYSELVTALARRR